MDGTLDVKVSEKTNLLRFAMMNFGENEFDPSRSPDEERLSGSNRVIFSEVTDSDGEQLQFMHNGHTLTVTTLLGDVDLQIPSSVSSELRFVDHEVRLHGWNRGLSRAVFRLE